jgi:hypothetical protein
MSRCNRKVHDAPSLPPSAHWGRVMTEYHRCRQCRGKLAAIVESDALAFCCRDCHRRFYWARCLVCEKPKSAMARSPYCGHTCKLEAQRNPAVVRHFRPHSEIQQNGAFPASGVAILTRGSGQATPDSKSPCAAATFSRDFCPRGWGWAIFAEGAQFDLLSGGANVLACVVFDGAEWVIRHPRAYPRPLAFTNRDDALREAVSLAAAALPLDAALIRRDRAYREQVERHLNNPTPLQLGLPH